MIFNIFEYPLTKELIKRGEDEHSACRFLEHLCNKYSQLNKNTKLYITNMYDIELSEYQSSIGLINEQTDFLKKFINKYKWSFPFHKLEDMALKIFMNKPLAPIEFIRRLIRLEGFCYRPEYFRYDSKFEIFLYCGYDGLTDTLFVNFGD